MLAIAASASSVVVRLKLLTLMTPMPSLTCHFTAGSSMMARVIATSNGLSRPGRTMVSLIDEPGVPRIWSTASSSVPP
jgi:hypothetical protein